MPRHYWSLFLGVEIMNVIVTHLPLSSLFPFPLVETSLLSCCQIILIYAKLFSHVQVPRGKF